MTRENKLALIVAFALILGVSVLMSDHLSSARSAQPGEVRETTRLPDVPERPIRTLDDSARVRRTPPGGTIFEPGTEPALAEGTPSMIESADERLAGGPGPRDGTLLGQFLEDLRGVPSALGVDAGSPGGGRGTPVDDNAPLVLNQQIARPTPRDAGAEAPTGPVRTHQVKSGESLYTIAARYYGNGNLWRDLARHNSDRVKADGTVNSGVSLRIPDRADLARRPGEAAPARPASTDAPAVQPEPVRPSQPRPEQPSRRTYTVARGDTLGEISIQTLGTSRRWREIYDLNKDKIPDPNNVRTGLVLVLPAS